MGDPFWGSSLLGGPHTGRPLHGRPLKGIPMLFVGIILPLFGKYPYVGFISRVTMVTALFTGLITLLITSVTKFMALLRV